MKIIMGIEYDGSRFSGWQLQIGVRTVQEMLELAIGKVADHPVRIICAGRTDTGVHATEQIIHFETEAHRPMRSWTLGSNTNLAHDASVLWTMPANSDDFHARFSAERRSYRYVILQRFTRPALFRQNCYWVHDELNIDEMQQAAQHLVGEHDFSSLRAAGCQSRSAVREITSIAVSREGDFIYIDVTANAFLYHMVRNIVGVLLRVGKGEAPVDWVAELLALRDRRQAAVTAPPNGLYLVKVGYPARFELPERILLPDFPAIPQV